MSTNTSEYSPITFTSTSTVVEPKKRGRSKKNTNASTTTTTNTTTITITPKFIEVDSSGEGAEDCLGSIDYNFKNEIVSPSESSSSKVLNHNISTHDCSGSNIHNEDININKSKCTFEQVYEYMSIRIGTDQAKIEAEKFVNYYESNGWKVGKNPMKSWGAAANNWITNSKQYAKGTTNNQRKLDKNELENLKNYNYIHSTSYGAGDYDRIFGGTNEEHKLYHI